MTDFSSEAPSIPLRAHAQNAVVRAAMKVHCSAAFDEYAT